MRSFDDLVDLSKIKYENSRTCIYSTNCYKIAILFPIFPKITNYFIIAADQNKKSIAYNALCVTCNKKRIERKNRMKRKVAWNGWYTRKSAPYDRLFETCFSWQFYLLLESKFQMKIFFISFYWRSQSAIY